MVGLAIVIAVGQLGKTLGVVSDGGNVLQELGSMFGQLRDWTWATVAIGAAALAPLFPIEGVAPKVLGALVVMLVAIAASAFLGFEAAGIHVFGEIPAELPAPGVPEGSAGN